MEVEEEVRRIVEQVKDLHDSATAFVSSSSHEELSLRKRSSAVDASITRLHSTIVSDKHLDPKLFDKALLFFTSPFDLYRILLNKKKVLIFFFFIGCSWRRICNELDACLPMGTLPLSSPPNLKVSLSLLQHPISYSLLFWSFCKWFDPFSSGRFVRMFLGPVNVRASRKDIQLKVKEEYNSYRVSISSPPPIDIIISSV